MALGPRQTPQDARRQPDPTQTTARAPDAAGGVSRGAALVAVGACWLGLILRLLAPHWATVASDGGAYWAAAQSIAHGHGFWMPWGSAASTGGAGSWMHHYPPAWPTALAVGAWLGWPAWATSLAWSTLGAAAVAAMAWNLYGPRWAILTGAVALTLPRLTWTTATGFSEPFLVAVFCGTLWALRRSLTQPRFTILAGALASLGFLTKATMGPFFLIAVAGGMAWRLRHHGPRSLLEPHYLAGGSIFATTVALWTWRNLATFGWPNWTTSTHNDNLVHAALQHPGLAAYAAAVKLPFFVAFLAGYAWLVQWRRRRLTESAEVMLLGAALTVFLGWLMASIYWVGEATSLFWLDNERYVVLAAIPLLWCAAELKLRVTTPRAAAWFTLALLLGAYVVADTGRFCDHEAVAAGVPPGATFSYLGATALYSAFEAQPAAAMAWRCDNFTGGCGGATYILDMTNHGPPPGFTWSVNQTVPHVLGPPERCSLYVRQ